MKKVETRNALCSRENSFRQKWSKGGSREHRDVVLLPRDLI